MLRLVLIAGGAEDIIRRLVRIKAAPRRGLLLLVGGVGWGEEGGGVGWRHVGSSWGSSVVPLTVR
jgi:uncharacterized protein YaaW (UPF0174 family)